MQQSRLSVGLRQEDTGELLAGQFSTGNLMVKNRALNCVSQVPNRCETWDIHLLLQVSIHCMEKLMLSEKHIPNQKIKILGMELYCSSLNAVLQVK